MDISNGSVNINPLTNGLERWNELASVRLDDDFLRKAF